MIGLLLLANRGMGISRASAGTVTTVDSVSLERATSAHGYEACKGSQCKTSCQSSRHQFHRWPRFAAFHCHSEFLVLLHGVGRHSDKAFATARRHHSKQGLCLYAVALNEYARQVPVFIRITQDTTPIMVDRTAQEVVWNLLSYKSNTSTAYTKHIGV